MVLIDNRETMGEVESFARFNERPKFRPSHRLCSVREEVHDDRPAVDRLLNGEERLARHPAVLDRLLPRLAVLADTDDDVEAVVAGVEALAVALRAVADEGERVILEVVLEPVAALVDDLLRTRAKSSIFIPRVDWAQKVRTGATKK